MRKIVEKSMLGNAWVVNDNIKNENNNSDNNLINSILATRGIINPDDVRKFLNPSVKEYMPNPNVLLDMDKVASVITDAIISNKKIAVYGDYDVDGITSTAIFVKYLRETGANVIWHLPTREGEGYGLNIEAIESLAKDSVDLIITVDCGISGIAEVKRAKELGLQIVITDHHIPDSIIPDADGVVNPKRNGDNSGLTYLAGVGVAFLALVAVQHMLREKVTDIFTKEKIEKINLLNYLDLVALGTVCDTMPLVGLNRAFVATGLKVMALRKNLGLRVLMDIAGVKKVSVYTLGFAIGPRLNAAGRLDSAMPALELLLTENVLIANDLANKLHEMNKERISIQNQIMLNATDMAESCCGGGKYSLFLCGDNWHGGVMGIIAGRLKDKYNIPACIATKNDGIINGSGRSVPGIDLGKIIHDALAAGIVSEGGGHAAAAGFTLPADKQTQFCEFLEKAVEQQMIGKSRIIEINVDAELDASAANMKLVSDLSALEPFGQDNPEPVLVLRGGTLGWVSSMGNGAHLRGTINTTNGQISFVGFNMVGNPIGDFLLDESNTNTKITMLGKLKENEYNGRITAQFILEDMFI